MSAGHPNRLLALPRRGNGAHADKEIGAQEGMALTFMATFDEREATSFEGSAYGSDTPRVPSTLREARDLFAGSAPAREAFGEDVVAHDVNAADVELRAVEAVVTDWKRFRGFERL